MNFIRFYLLHMNVATRLKQLLIYTNKINDMKHYTNQFMHFIVLCVDSFNPKHLRMLNALVDLQLLYLVLV